MENVASSDLEFRNTQTLKCYHATAMFKIQISIENFELIGAKLYLRSFIEKFQQENCFDYLLGLVAGIRAPTPAFRVSAICSRLKCHYLPIRPKKIQ